MYAASEAVAIISSGWEPTAGHLARTAAHLTGIIGGLVIIYLANRIRLSTIGSSLARISKLVMIATGLFVLVFLDMEAGHILGVNLWYFTESMLMGQLGWMTTLAVVLTLYALSYRKLVRELGV